jgi:hypothetical protein
MLAHEWQRLITVHQELCVTFAYLDQHMTRRESMKTIPELCKDARAGCSAWEQLRAAGWAPPCALPEPGLAPEQPVLPMRTRTTRARAIMMTGRVVGTSLTEPEDRAKKRAREDAPGRSVFEEMILNSHFVESEEALFSLSVSITMAARRKNVQHDRLP